MSDSVSDREARHEIEAALEVIRRDGKFSERVEARAVIFEIADERDRLRAENEALKAAVESHRAMAMERDDFLYRIGKISREYEDRLAELSDPIDENGDSA